MTASEIGEGAGYRAQEVSGRVLPGCGQALPYPA